MSYEIGKSHPDSVGWLFLFAQRSGQTRPYERRRRYPNKYFNDIGLFDMVKVQIGNFLCRYNKT